MNQFDCSVVSLSLSLLSANSFFFFVRSTFRGGGMKRFWKNFFSIEGNVFLLFDRGKGKGISRGVRGIMLGDE